ncbi:MAG TPA: hypothetical protein VIW24_17520 [Aldersonia sp.]
MLDSQEVEHGNEVVGVGCHRERPGDFAAAPSSAQIRCNHREVGAESTGERAEVQMFPVMPCAARITSLPSPHLPTLKFPPATATSKVP